MKYIKGEIYTSHSGDNRVFVWKCRGGIYEYSHRIFAYDYLTDCRGLEYRKRNDTHGYPITRFPTPEEKHWLEQCIKLDKEVSYQEALKTFKGTPIYEIY